MPWSSSCIVLTAGRERRRDGTLALTWLVRSNCVRLEPFGKRFAWGELSGRLSVLERL